MPRKGWTRGKAVVDGELQYVSPSQIDKADPNMYGGCLLWWFFEKVLRRPGAPQGKAAADGEKGHGRIEAHLTTGDMTLGQWELAGKHLIPAPGQDLLVEQSIDDGTVFAAGIPVAGFIDCVNPRGETILPSGDLILEPGVVEVIDWKFTGKIEKAKTPQQVGVATPMLAYGMWAAGHHRRDWVRLSHVYFSMSKRASLKSSTLVSASDFFPRWNRAESVVRSMIDAASETDPAKIPANTRSCDAWRGCPHQSVCPAGKNKTLTDLFGATGAANLLGQKEKHDMAGLLDLPGLQDIGAPASVNEQVEAAKAELQAAEAPAVTPEIERAIAAIHAYGLGTPTLGGEAAKVWAVVHNHDLKGDGLAGAGKLSGAQLSEASQIVELAAELEQKLGPPKSAPSALPPDAPASDPALASIKPDEPVAPPPSTETVPTLPERPAKLSKVAAKYVEALEAEITALRGQSSPATSPPMAPIAPMTGLTVFVDCVANAADLSSWVSGLAKKLADQFGAADIRCAPSESPLSFGKWKGALAALVRESDLVDGEYTLDTRGSEIMEVAAEALRDRGRVIRGIR